MMWKKVIWLNFIDPALGKYNSQNNNNSALYWSHNGETYGVSLLQTSQAATRGAIWEYVVHLGIKSRTPCLQGRRANQYIMEPQTS